MNTLQLIKDRILLERRNEPGEWIYSKAYRGTAYTKAPVQSEVHVEGRYRGTTCMIDR
jgi:hypothetical protein